MIFVPRGQGEVDLNFVRSGYKVVWLWILWPFVRLGGTRTLGYGLTLRCQRGVSPLHL